MFDIFLNIIFLKKLTTLLKRLTQFLKFYTISESFKLKIAPKAIFLAQSKINLYLCTRNESAPWDYVFKGGQLQDIIKAS